MKAIKIVFLRADYKQCSYLFWSCRIISTYSSADSNTHLFLWENTSQNCTCLQIWYPSKQRWFLLIIIDNAAGHKCSHNCARKTSDCMALSDAKTKKYQRGLPLWGQWILLRHVRYCTHQQHQSISMHIRAHKKQNDEHGRKLSPGWVVVAVYLPPRRKKRLHAVSGRVSMGPCECFLCR